MPCEEVFLHSLASMDACCCCAPSSSTLTATRPGTSARPLAAWLWIRMKAWEVIRVAVLFWKDRCVSTAVAGAGAESSLATATAAATTAAADMPVAVPADAAAVAGAAATGAVAAAVVAATASVVEAISAALLFPSTTTFPIEWNGESATDSCAAMFGASHAVRYALTSTSDVAGSAERVATSGTVSDRLVFGCEGDSIPVGPLLQAVTFAPRHGTCVGPK